MNKFGRDWGKSLIPISKWSLLLNPAELLNNEIEIKDWDCGNFLAQSYIKYNT